MKYKMQKRKNPRDMEAAEKYYATPVWDGIVDLDYVSRRIAGRSSLTVGDISNVLKNFLDEVPALMLLGKSVKLDEVGILRISFSSAGVEDPKKFKTTMVRDVKVQFRPSVKVMDEIRKGISFEKVD